jgi:hypothetical protein
VISPESRVDLAGPQAEILLSPVQIRDLSSVAGGVSFQDGIKVIEVAADSLA